MKINRREFLKTIGSSPFLLSLPAALGCDAGGTHTASLVKHTDDYYAIRQAVDMVGGFEFLNPGDSVLLKLALNSPNPFPATTSPSMISHVVTLLKEHGAGDVFVADRSPSWQDTMDCLQQTGIYDAAIDAGAEVLEFAEEDMVSVNPARAQYWPRGFSMPAVFNQVDHIIVLPTLRTHGGADFTMGLKIFVGVLPQQERTRMHASPHFLKRIAEISLCTDKIRLSILDARQGFSEGGPDDGTLVTPGIIIASTCLPAADAAGIALLKTIGTTGKLMRKSVWDHPTIRRAVNVHAPSLSPETLELVSEGIDDIDAIAAQLV